MSLLFLIINSSSSSGTISGTIGTLINAVSVLDYGAIGDGITDDTAALAAAVATGKLVYVPKNKNIKITGNTGGGVSGQFAAVKLAAGQLIVGEDKRTSKITVTGNGRGIQLGDDSGVFNLTMAGSGIGSGNSFNAGILPYGLRWMVQDCTFTDFGGSDATNGGGAIYGISTTALGANWQDGGFIRDCHFIANKCGVNFDDQAEYNTVVNSHFARNTTAIYNKAGNSKFIGLNIHGNTTGFALASGSNDGHCVMSGCTVNHNTTNLSVSGITNGFVFSGCMFYGGAMSVVNSTGVRFVGSDLVGNGAAFTATNSTILIDGCRYPKAPTATAFALTNSGSTITEGTNLNF